MKKGIVNKKPLYALVGLSLISVISVTLAFFTDTKDIPNVFKTKQYSTEVTEEFVSPEDWRPGTETSKTIISTNTGEVDVAVRASYTEEWISKNGGVLDLKQGDETAAIINFANTSDWEEENGYYYYNKKLTTGNSTSSFIESVTFNENIKSDALCTESDDGKTKTCTSTGDGYDGATYTLTIKIETAQYDKYKKIWGTNVEIN